jgi:hypothetical protein
MSESIVFFKEFKVLSKLKVGFFNEIKLLYVFENIYDNGNNVLIVTNDDNVYAFGTNTFGVLGFGENDCVNELTLNKELSHKRMIDFKNSFCHVIARTIDGKVYCWGSNDSGVLGNGKNDCKIYSPELNEYLSDKYIIDICCGSHHSLILTNSGEVYAWGRNYLGQIWNVRNSLFGYQLIPIKVNCFNDEKVIMISCGFHHSMALTKSGRVFSWGSNRSGQLGLSYTNYVNEPSLVFLDIEIPIKKISCGHSHSLLLSQNGDIYWFGNNGIEEQIIPQKITINKFVDIASHPFYSISIAHSVSGIYYVWGNFGEEIIVEPKETEFQSFDDIFNIYFDITYRVIHRLDEFLRTLFSLKHRKNEINFNEKSFISSGNFGIVCNAIERNSGKTFAIKKIPLNEGKKERVCKESKISAKLSDYYVVQCFDVWIEENYLLNNKSCGLSSRHKVFDKQNTLLLHIQMELCFKSLREIINEELKNVFMTTLVYYISSELFIELLECVNYIHKQNIIHRDLKPENILLTFGTNGRFVKLCDFGLSTFHEFEEQSHTKYSGTKGYAAPEVMNTKYYDTKADIYSLGVIVQDLFNIDINE